MKSLGALDGSSVFTREYIVKLKEKETTFQYLDDLLEFIQEEMLTAFDDTEMVVSLRRTKGNTDGKDIRRDT